MDPNVRVTLYLPSQPSSYLNKSYFCISTILMNSFATCEWAATTFDDLYRDQLAPVPTKILPWWLYPFQDLLFNVWHSWQWQLVQGESTHASRSPSPPLHESLVDHPRVRQDLMFPGWGYSPVESKVRPILQKRLPRLNSVRLPFSLLLPSSPTFAFYLIFQGSTSSDSLGHQSVSGYALGHPWGTRNFTG